MLAEEAASCGCIADVATLFVNGVPVFTGDASYSFDRPRREGLIGSDQARLYVALRAGVNQLAVLITTASVDGASWADS